MRPRAYSYLRMSTDIQLKGDSRRRQLEASNAYAEDKGLELAKEDQLEDIGISAFKGANVKEGALGRFLEAVESGSVPKGSYLLVESLDRISRQKIDAGLALFLRIINSGINVVTLIDKRVFRAGEVDLTDLIISLVTMSRAHEESLVKGQRVGAAWTNKREQASSGRPMTKWAPAWLTLSPDRTRYEVIPERVEVVRSIFEDAAAGIGMYRIAVRLNDSKTPIFNPSNGWHQSYVSKILSNRAVLGEFQPHKRVDGKHLPDGEPIDGYFPEIVDRELFYRAQNGKAQRRVNGAGRKGAGFANLFGGLAACLYCGSTMKFENKGSGRKGGTYLICNNAKRQLGCVGTRWKYSDLEASFLTFVREIDLKSILITADEEQERNKSEAEIAALAGELASVERLMEQTYELLSNAGTELAFVSKKLQALAERQIQLEAHLAAKRHEKASLEAREERFTTSRDEIEALVVQLQGAPTSDLYQLRARIASRLRALVVSLRIAPLGNIPRIYSPTTTIRDLLNGPKDEFLEFASRVSEIPSKTPRRYFSVSFANAAARIIYPDSDDPLRYEMKVEMRGTGDFSVDRAAGEAVDGETEPTANV